MQVNRRETHFPEERLEAQDLPAPSQSNRMEGKREGR